MLISTAWSNTPENWLLTVANRAGGTGIEATLPAIFVEDSCKLVSLSGTKVPWINSVNVNSVLASLIAHDPWSCGVLSSSLQTKNILLFSATSIALFAELLHCISLKKAVTIAPVISVPDGMLTNPFCEVASVVKTDLDIV